MGKHTKLKQKRAPVAASTATAKAAPANEPPQASEMDAVLAETLDFLQMLLRTVKDSPETTPALLRESAGLARAVVQLSGEQRSRRKLWVRDARTMSLSMVMEFLRAMPELDRHNVIRELTEFDAGGSVLA